MNTSNYSTIDYEWLFKPTGDPFANAGGYALKVFAETFPNDDILRLIRRATDIYVDKWDSKLNTFFLNSKITQPAFKPEQKKEETLKYFKSLINNENAKNGYCRISGRETSVFAAGRDNSVLSGSGKFVNFHHGFDNGIMLSKEILIRLFFLPLAVNLLNGKVCVIDSSNQDISERFASDNCKNVFSEIAQKCSEGVIKSPSAAPSTELFRFADKIIKACDETDDKDYSLNLYLFTNFGAKPELDIYILPFEGMDFYRFVNKAKYKDDWLKFISTKFFCYNTKTKKREWAGDNSEIGENEFKYWKNSVYENFINGKSILSDILLWSKNNIFNFDIVKYYELKVRKMKKETIQKVEQMADFIFEGNDKFSIEKAVKKLYAVDSSYDLRRYVIKDIVAKYYEKHADDKQAIVTVDDYANYLFPDTDSWKETRDVLIIALFQKLHAQNMNIEIEDDNQQN